MGQTSKRPRRRNSTGGKRRRTDADAVPLIPAVGATASQEAQEAEPAPPAADASAGLRAAEDPAVAGPAQAAPPPSAANAADEPAAQSATSIGDAMVRVVANLAARAADAEAPEDEDLPDAQTLRIRVRRKAGPPRRKPAVIRHRPRVIIASLAVLAVVGFFVGLELGQRQGSLGAREEVVREMRRNSAGRTEELAMKFGSSNWPTYPRTHIVSLVNLPNSKLQCPLDHTRSGEWENVDVFRSGWYRTCLWGEKDVTLDITEARKYEGVHAARNIEQFYRAHLGWEAVPDYSPLGVRRVWVQEVDEGARSLLQMRFQLFINRAVN